MKLGGTAMTYPYKEPLFSNFLLVRMALSPGSLADFSRHMRALVGPVFRDKLGWQLLRAGKLEPAPSNEEHIVHLWQLPEPANLWQGMYTVAGNSSYAELNKLVLREAQELLRLAPLSPVKLELDCQSNDLFAICELELVQDWKLVCRWRERLLSFNVQKQTGPDGWPLYATFRPQTGNLRRQLNVWQVDEKLLGNAAAWQGQNPAPSDQLANGPQVATHGQIEVYEVLRY